MALSLKRQNDTSALALRAGLVLLSLVTLTVVFTPQWRQQISQQLRPQERQVVSSVQGHLAGDDQLYTVVKVRTADGLSLEVYGPETDGQMSLLDSLQLDAKRDAHLNLQGRTTNLALADFNKDGRIEIVVPSFDATLVGRLHIYQFDSQTQKIGSVTQ